MADRLRISPAFCITLALMLLILPLQWLLAAAAAAAIHELCHYGALRLCGLRPGRLSLGVNGAVMQAEFLPCRKELLCALAGPLGSLSLLFLARWFPRIALCGGFHGLYNLLPLYPLDGGRILRCGARLLLPPKLVPGFCSCMESLCLAGFCLLGIYAAFGLHLGFLPLAVAAALIFKRQKGKIPCKPGRLGVQ